MGATSPSSVFVSKHLRVPPEDLQKTIANNIEGVVEKFTNNKSESSGYIIVCCMLNEISRQIQNHLGLPKLVFADHHSSLLRHHPCPTSNAKPDIVVLAESYRVRIPKEKIPKSKTRKHPRYYRLPWHLADSVGEVKPRRDSEGPSQVAAYAGFLNQARPDKPGVYAISLSPRWYRVLWSDPSGLYSSGNIPWDNLGPLISYVFFLYNPPQSHLKLDVSVTLDQNRDIMLSPRWMVKFQETLYPLCRVIFVGSPWTRQSWIAVSETDNGQRIIKDQYQSEGRRYDEGELFDKLQSDIPDACAPGCIRVELHGIVEGVQTPIVATRRRKLRIVMTTLGEPLYDCGSVFGFLKVMYDALEAHRWILVAKGILHRDVSINNILLPHNESLTSRTPDIRNRPKFIEEVLNPNIVRAPSTALLCDFDNACVYQLRSSADSPQGQSSADGMPVATKNEDSDDIRRASKELKNCTGTPAFIARSVAKDGGAKAAYELARDDDLLRKYEDSKDLRHGGKMISGEELVNSRSATGANSLKGRFFHQPMHDAESVFWVIVSYLLRARPIEDAESPGDGKGVESGDERMVDGGGDQPNEVVADDDEGGDRDRDEDGGDNRNGGDDDGDEEQEDEEEDETKEVEEEANDSKLDMIWKFLAEHAIEGNTVDSRDGIFNIDLDQWEGALHPKLAFLAPILVELCTQVQPEYSHIEPKPQELHLHEAIQRILFTYIWNMKDLDPIPLDRRHRAVTIRRYDVRVHTIDPLSFGSKRSPHDEELPTKHEKRQKRH